MKTVDPDIRIYSHPAHNEIAAEENMEKRKALFLSKFPDSILALTPQGNEPRKSEGASEATALFRKTIYDHQSHDTADRLAARIHHTTNQVFPHDAYRIAAPQAPSHQLACIL